MTMENYFLWYLNFSDRCAAARLNRNMRTVAIAARGNAPRTVVNEVLAGATDDVVAALPKIPSLEKAVRRKRCADGGQILIPKTLSEIQIPQVNI